jgi:hypothetical protein
MYLILISTFWDSDLPQEIHMFGNRCNSYFVDNVRLTKLWASYGIHLTVYSLDQEVLPAMLMTDYYHLAVILNLNCSGSGHLIAQVWMKIY